RTGEQDVVGGAAPQPRGLEHQGQLLAHPLLPHELVEVRGPQRRLELLLVGLVLPRDQPVPGVHGGAVVAGHAQAPRSAGTRGPALAAPSHPSTVRRIAGTSPEAASSSLPERASAMPRAASFSFQPRPTRASSTCSRHGSIGAAAAGWAGRSGTMSLSASSSTIRRAPLGPMPGTVVNALASPCAM